MDEDSWLTRILFVDFLGIGFNKEVDNQCKSSLAVQRVNQESLSLNAEVAQIIYLSVYLIAQIIYLPVYLSVDGMRMVCNM